MDTHALQDMIPVYEAGIASIDERIEALKKERAAMPPEERTSYTRRITSLEDGRRDMVYALSELRKYYS